LGFYIGVTQSFKKGIVTGSFPTSLQNDRNFLYRSRQQLWAGSSGRNRNLWLGISMDYMADY